MDDSVQTHGHSPQGNPPQTSANIQSEIVPIHVGRATHRPHGEKQPESHNVENQGTEPMPPGYTDPTTNPQERHVQDAHAQGAEYHVIRQQPIYLAPGGPVYMPCGHVNQSGMLVPGNWLALLAGSVVVQIDSVSGWMHNEFHVFDSVRKQTILQASSYNGCSGLCGGDGQEVVFTDMTGVQVMRLAGLFKPCIYWATIMCPVNTPLATVSIANFLSTVYECADMNDRLMFKIEIDRGASGFTKTHFTVVDGNGYEVGKFVFHMQVSGSTIEFHLPVAPEAKAILLAAMLYVMLIRISSST